MGQLVLMDHDIVRIMIQSQAVVIQRSNIQELIEASIVEWSESTNEDDVFKKIPQMGGYYQYLGSSGDQFFKQNSKEYAVLEQNLLNEIINAIRNQPNILSFQVEQGEHLFRTLQIILNYSEKNNKTIGYRVSRTKTDPDPQFIIFDNSNIFRRFLKIQSVDSVIKTFRLSELKEITSNDGLNFNIKLDSTFEEEISYASFNRTELQNVSIDISIRNKIKPFWQKKAFLISFIILSLLYIRYDYRSHENIQQNDWMSYLSSSCNKTISGNLKTVFYDDLDFWSHVDVSMEFWAREWRLYGRDCDAIDGSTLDGQKSRAFCFAVYKEKWDWFNRCRPVVKRACYLSGGRC